MTAPADPRLRQQARSVLARHADGAAGADAIAAAADRSYGDLVRAFYSANYFHQKDHVRAD